MMQKSHRDLLRSHGMVVARVALGALFFLSGLQILLNGMDGINGVADMIASKGIPLSFIVALAVVAIKLGAGGALILGYRTGLAAGLLLLFTAGTIVLFHASPDQSPMGLFGMQMAFFKNLSIMGGLLYAMAYGPGEGWSISNMKKEPIVSL